MAPAPAPPGTLLVERARVAPGPQDAVGVIFDPSGSMLQRIDGVRRVEIARQTLGHLENVEGKRLLIVLTDGEETCDGDAAAAIGSLRAHGWDITVNIVGFAINDAALQAELAAWAELGGGAYFSAADRVALE